MTALIHDHRDTPDTLDAGTGWPATGFAARAQVDGRGSVLRVYGEIDLASAALLRRAAHDALAGSSGRMHLDLGQVSFFDCAGLGVLIALRNTALHSGAPPPRITASRPVRRLVTLAGLGDLFDLDPDPTPSPGHEGVAT